MQQEGVSNRQVLNNQLQGISTKLQGIADKIDSNAARTISDAISRLDLVVNNYINP